jgi:TRAP-type mannitol/chloroaromatic compound transport system substrate-binding protein
MGRTVLAAMAVVLLLGLVAGCAAEPSPTPTTPTPPTTPTTPTAPTNEVFKWTAQIAPASASMWFQNWDRFTKRLAEASNGRIVITLNPGGAICPAAQEVFAVNDGVMPFAIIGAAHYMGTVPTGAVLGGYMVGAGINPYAFSTWISEGDGAELLDRAFAEVAPNVTLFGASAAVIGPELWAHSTKQIRSMSDFKGLKIRVLGDGGSIFNRMGASTISMPPGEIYEALQRGVIDAAENSGPAENLSYGYHEVAKYVYLSSSRGNLDCTLACVSNDEWAKVPADLKALVEDELRAGKNYQIEHNITADIAALEQMKAKGAIVNPLPQDIEKEIVKAAATYYAEKRTADPFYDEVMTSLEDWRDAYDAYFALVEPDLG